MGIYLSEEVGITATVAVSEAWWSQTSGAHEVIERTLNHLHLWDLFEPDGEAEEQALVELAQRIARAWKLTAETKFPDRLFTVTVTDDYGPTVVVSSRYKEAE